MTQHAHTPDPAKSFDIPFTGPVREPPLKSAHGHFCHVHICHCGMVRKTNFNKGALEMGRWYEI